MNYTEPELSFVCFHLFSFRLLYARVCMSVCVCVCVCVYICVWMCVGVCFVWQYEGRRCVSVVRLINFVPDSDRHYRSQSLPLCPPLATSAFHPNSIHYKPWSLTVWNDRANDLQSPDDKLLVFLWNSSLEKFSRFEFISSTGCTPCLIGVTGPISRCRFQFS